MSEAIKFIAAVILSGVFAFGALAAAPSVAELPPEPEWSAEERPDWLLDPSPYQASVYRGGAENELILSNGLLRRTFRLAPNGATVGFDNLATGESIIRGVKPEAMVELDGVRYDVGGLKGQRNYAFLRPAWVDELTADPGAFQLVGFAVGEPAERMAWKRVRHHAAGVKWPPPGAYLRMDYEMPRAAALLKAGKPQPSALGRKRLFADDFKALDAGWKVHVSKAHPRSSFQNEGKVGEIYTPANTCVFAERALPPETRLVEATLDLGTDRSASWGPGVVLVWPRRTIKFYLRPGGNDAGGVPRLGLWDGGGENINAGGGEKVDPGQPWTLRLRVEYDAVYCEAKTGAGAWRTCERVKLSEPLGAPTAVRVGKTSRSGGADDFGGEKGELMRLRVLNFAAYSGLNEAALAEIESKTADQRKVKVSVHYELYDGVPCLSKWITIHNGGKSKITVNRFTSEILAAVEYASTVEDRGMGYPHPNVHVETDFCMGGGTAQQANRFAVHWGVDPEYSTQVNYLRQTPCLLEVRPELGPEQAVEPGATFESFRAFVLPLEGYDRERNGLAQRRMYRVIAPWTTENPLMMHVRRADWEAVKLAVDQCAEVGFELVILTFGSGFNIENDSDEYLARMKQYADYARSKGIEIGGYSLLASRRVGGGNDVVMPAGARPTFGNSPCLRSKWGEDYFRKLYQFYEKTDHLLLEHDGSYPGDPCLATEHPGHAGHADSRWAQWRLIADFYKWCRGRGVYLNVPDYYYLAGSNKCGMGYREVNWSLPREQQVIHTRLNIFDGTWSKGVTMGWMFVPLTQYHGGGAAATIEPLHEHLAHYERMVTSNLGAGVQACYRGPRLYDTDETKAMLQRWVGWFKEHRATLEGDLIHLRRPDAQDLDYWLMVNPHAEEKGLLMVFNPLREAVTRTLRVPLYYTGLTRTASVAHEGGAPQSQSLPRDLTIRVKATVPPGSMTWFTIK